MRRNIKTGLFIIGEAKSGTHALFKMLNQHPQLCGSKVKEPLYFCRDLWEESDRFHRPHRWLVKDHYPCRSEEQYLALFAHCDPLAIRFEASTRYAYSKTAAAEIRKYNPKARIIYLIRDPVDYVYSYHSEALVSRSDVRDFRRALELEPLRRAGKRVPRAVANPSELFYSERVRYADHIQRYLEALGSDNVKIIVYDDFRDDNLRIFKEICAWLGIDASYTPTTSHEHGNRRPKIPWLFHGLNSPLLWKIPKFVLPRLLYERISNRVRGMIGDHLLDFKPRKPMDDTLRKTLQRRFGPEVQRMSTLLKRDLAREWGYDETVFEQEQVT